MSSRFNDNKKTSERACVRIWTLLFWLYISLSKYARYDWSVKYGPLNSKVCFGHQNISRDIINNNVFSARIYGPVRIALGPKIRTEKISVRNLHYSMAVSQKDWELPNSRIWLAEIDIDWGLDFPI